MPDPAPARLAPIGLMRFAETRGRLRSDQVAVTTKKGEALSTAEADTRGPVARKMEPITPPRCKSWR